MGAIEDAQSMILAGREMNQLGRPVVLDPVAAGGTSLRREVAAELLKEVKFSSIRGNASEIRYLAGQQTAGSGVDVGALDKITEENLKEASEMVRTLAERTGSVIAVSGKLDLVSDGKETAVLRNGCATMARITGSGCMLTSMIGAFCGAMPEDCFTATVAAMSVMGTSGELAEARRIKNGTGNATFRTDLMVMRITVIALFVLGGISELMFDYQSCIDEKDNSIVKSRAAHTEILLVSHQRIKRIDVKMTINGIDSIEYGIAFGSLAMPVRVEIFSEYLLYRIFHILTFHFGGAVFYSQQS